MNSAAQSQPKIKAVLRGCPNQKASKMEICEPWLFTPAIPIEARKDKPSFRSWQAEETTQHLFFSASEGVCPTLRVSKSTNPMVRLHGFIADYDADITVNVIEAQLAQWAGENAPNWVSRTFSDGVRGLWFFEQPLVLNNSKIIEPFLKLAAEELRVGKMFPGWEESAWTDLSKIYDVGRDWRQVSHSPLPIDRLYEMLVRTATKVRWSAEKTEVPLEVVAAEVERKFPRRWDGPFEVGNRGVCFWNPDSTNPTSSIVTEDGMICFSQEKIFYPWREIFGDAFVRQYEEDRIGRAASEAWYDGKSYWLKSDEGIWQPHQREDYAIRLRVRHGLHPTKRGETCSQVDRVLDFVHTERRVAGAVPRLFSDEDIVTINGRRYVNCAAARALPPAEEPQEWGVNFPWLAQFLAVRFDDLERGYLLGWMKRFYQSARAGDLLKGHALFLVGEINLGKTLFTNRVVGGLVGGFSDASAYVTKGSEFNRELIETPLWTLDDGEVATDLNAHKRFSEIVKRLVANPVMQYRAMFRDGQSTTWNGRLIVTLNDDAQSLGMIPDLETSMEEKVMVLRFRAGQIVFPSKYVLETTIARELPFFARYLLDWEVPKEIVGDNRLGVKHHINEELRAKALYSGDVGDLLEIVNLWKKRCRPEESHGRYWQGIAAEWLTDARSDDALRDLLQKQTTRSVGKKFAAASKLRDSGIEIVPSGYKGNGNRYRIKLSPEPEEERRRVRTSFCDIAMSPQPAQAEVAAAGV
jgi:hypothetical protein